MIKFDLPKFDFCEFKQCFLENAENIRNDFNKINSSMYNCAKTYCELVEGLWNEDLLGNFKNELYAIVLEMYILVNSSPYHLHKYCSCNNPYNKHNISEIQFIERCIAGIYAERYLKSFSAYTDFFKAYDNNMMK